MENSLVLAEFRKASCHKKEHHLSTEAQSKVTPLYFGPCIKITWKNYLCFTLDDSFFTCIQLNTMYLSSSPCVGTIPKTCGFSNLNAYAVHTELPVLTCTPWPCILHHPNRSPYLQIQKALFSSWLFQPVHCHEPSNEYQ